LSQFLCRHIAPNKAAAAAAAMAHSHYYTNYQLRAHRKDDFFQRMYPPSELTSLLNLILLATHFHGCYRVAASPTAHPPLNRCCSQ